MQKKSLELLKSQEGFRSKPYRDSLGVLTIGYGTNILYGLDAEELDILPHNICLEDGITEGQAELLLMYRLEQVEEFLSQYVRNWSGIEASRRDVISNMGYNLGVNKLKQFKKFLYYVETQDYDSAAREMLDSRWAKQVGNRARILADIMRGVKE